jgi:hypothetical protein
MLWRRRQADLGTAHAGADHDHCRAHATTRHGQLPGDVSPDEVQDHRRAPTASKALDLLGGLGVGRESLMGTVLLGERELVVADVQRDHPGRRELTEKLNGDVPKTTGTDDHRGRSTDQSR